MLPLEHMNVQFGNPSRLPHVLAEIYPYMYKLKENLKDSY